MRRCALTCTVVLAVMAAFAAPAGATQVVGTDGGLVGPLAAFGDGALWVAEPFLQEATGDEETSVTTSLWLGRGGARPRRIAAVGYHSGYFPYERRNAVTSLGASQGHVAYSTAEVDSAKSKYTGNGLVSSRVRLIDPVSGTATTVVECGEFFAASSALAWPWLVTGGCGGAAGPGPGPVQARDLSRPGSAPLTLAPSGTDVQASGSIAAWWAGRDLVVYDVAAGREVQRVSAGALPLPAGPIDLGADGTVAVAFQSAPGRAVGYDRIALAAPGAPGLAVVAPGGRFSFFELDGGRLVFERLGARAADRDELVSRSLTGGEHVIARYSGLDRFDIDGERVAWARSACSTTEIVAGGIDDVIDDHTVDVCPLRLDGGRARVTTAARLRVGAVCDLLSPARPGDACRIVATLRSRGRILATIRRRVAAGDSLTLRFPPRHRLLRQRPRTIALRVRAQMRGGTRVTRRTLRPAYPKARAAR